MLLLPDLVIIGGNYSQSWINPMEIARLLESDLIRWHTSPTRKPLLIRGARQVGKSFLIESFGKKYFQNVVTINFELNPEYKKCFQTLQPQEICDAIRVLSQQKILAGESLFFFY